MKTIDSNQLLLVNGGMSSSTRHGIASGLGAVAAFGGEYLAAPAVPWLAAGGGIGGLAHGAYHGAKAGYARGGVGTAMLDGTTRAVKEGVGGAVGMALLPGVAAGTLTESLANRALR